MQNQVTLTEVKQAFEQWRASKLNRREKTPKHLRQQVQAIAPYYSKRQIMAALAITQAQMCRFAPSEQDAQALSHRMNELPSGEFVEVSMPEFSKVKSDIAPSTELTIIRCDGARLAISKVGVDVIVESLRLFLRG